MGQGESTTAGGLEVPVETGVADAELVAEYFGAEVGSVVLSKQVYALRNEVVKIRRDLHRHPELSLEEKWTNAYIVNYLSKLPGVRVTHKQMGGYGVVGVIEGAFPGPCVLLRADIDALPVTESTDLSFKSEMEGVMHACGHDCHAAIGLTNAKILSSLRQYMHGSVKMVFQPAEELAIGAEAMINEGVMDGVDVCYGLHVYSHEDCGKVICAPKELMAGNRQFEITVGGKGGHASGPHLCKDPNIAAAYLVLQLHSIVDRSVDAFNSAVITVGSFNGGNTHNVIPQSATLQGTVRFFDDETRELLEGRMAEVCEGIALTYGVEVELNWGTVAKLTPAVINHQSAFDSIEKVCGQILESGKFVNRPKMTMGAEDFSHFLHKKPGAFFFLGAKIPGNDETSHHDSKFEVDERCLPIGVQIMCTLALEHLIKE